MTASRVLPFSRPVRSAKRKPAASASGAMVSMCWRARTSVGGHQRRLGAGFDGDGHRQQSDDGFAGTDVALKETEHTMRGREIGGDLFKRGFLRPRQGEGKSGCDLGADVAIAPTGGGRARS